MNDRAYYYIISGLPNLDPDQRHPPFEVTSFRQELKEHLHPEDDAWMDWLFLPYDNQNLLVLTHQSRKEWHPLGRFSPDEMEEKLKNQKELPAYMHQFYAAVRDENPIFPDTPWDNQLALLFFAHALSCTNPFLRSWFEFDNYLKNFLTSWNIRQYLVSPTGQFVGTEEMIQEMEKLPGRDTGLSAEMPYTDKILAALDEENLYERERMIDRLKWSFIDELNTFHYFSIEVLLGYLLKCIMLDRWQRLEKKELDIRTKINEMDIPFEGLTPNPPQIRT